MVEASANPIQASSSEPPLPVPKKQPTTEITTCAHEDQLQTYCRRCDMALCNDCYFEYHVSCGKGQTLKAAAAQQITQFEQLLNDNNTSFAQCSEMANTVER